MSEPRDPWDFEEQDWVDPELPGDTIQARFEAFHAENPWIYGELLALAREVAAAGGTRISIRALWEGVRWKRFFTTHDASSEFKLNDHYPSRYVRLMITEHPELGELFELRALRSP